MTTIDDVLGPIAFIVTLSLNLYFYAKVKLWLEDKAYRKKRLEEMQRQAARGVWT